MPKKPSPNDILKRGHNDLPATVGLVKEVRSELRAEFRKLDSKIDSVNKNLSSKISQVLVAVHASQADVHRMQVIVEEQRGENRIVLDGLKNLWDRQDKIESNLETRY